MLKRQIDVLGAMKLIIQIIKMAFRSTTNHLKLAGVICANQSLDII